MGVKNRITSWSFSRYNVYKQCPYKAKLKFIDKIQEPPNEAMERGSRIHDLAEGFIKGQVSAMPEELKKFAKLFRKLKRQYKKSINGMVVEDTWAFTKNWEETSWNDWANCWVRVKLDCAEHSDDETMVVSDWKTGKLQGERNIEYVEQLELYGLAALLLHKHIQTVKPRLVYLDHGLIYPAAGSMAELIFTRKDIPKLRETWNARVRAMLNDKTFAPRPTNNCRWCHYRKSNANNGGGQCKY